MNEIVNKNNEINNENNNVENELKELRKLKEERRRKDIEEEILYERLKERRKEDTKKEKERIEKQKEEIKKQKGETFSYKEIHEMAMEFIKLHGNRFRTIRTDKLQKEMFIYRKKFGHYFPEGASYIHEHYARDYKTSNKYFTSSFIKTVQENTFIDRDDFINPSNMVNLKNKVYNLETNELLEHSPDYNFTGILEIEYDKNADCPLFKRALERMFSTPSDLLRTQKWFGYQFVRENREQIAHGYFGESGSGKGQLLKILRDLLGGKNVTSFNLQEFSNPNMYALANLYKKYSNICYDMSTSQMRDISNFKMITAGDPITGRNIYKEPFTFINHAKLSWACNKLPKISNEILNSVEFKRRIMLTRTRKGHEDEDIDKDIYYKFKKELPGIFNWAVEGYRLYFKHDGFNYDHDEIPSIWKENMDTSYDKVDEDKHDTISEIDRVEDKNSLLYREKLENQSSLIQKELEKLNNELDSSEI